MKILSIDINVDKLPDGCSVDNEYDEACVFNQSKYCVLKIALERNNTFVVNNRGIVPEDCPLRR